MQQIQNICFFAQYITEQKKVQDSISIALRKVRSHSLTAGEVRSMDSSSFQNLIFSDQAYLFMKNIPGSPSYWKRFMYEVIAIIKQLGPPSWWMTLSCADLRWNVICKILSKLKGKEMTDDEIAAMSYDEKCEMLNSNPVVVAKHFQFRLERLFKDLILSASNPLGKVQYYAIRIEFQFWRSTHAHCFIWVKDFPLLTEETTDYFVEFIDQHVQAYFPDPLSEPELHQLVKMYQTHAHSETCRRYKNLPCRFNFGHFFTNRTIVAKPLASHVNGKERCDTLALRKNLLMNIKTVINETLNPSRKETYNPNRTIEDILHSFDITENDYYKTLSTEAGTDYELHLKRPPNSCFINNYSPSVLKAWQANMDLQPVFNHHKCVTYLCSYMSKGDTQCSEAIRTASLEAKISNLGLKNTLKKIGAAFLSTREVSSQECVYQCLPELWLPKTFPGTIFINIDLPEKRIRTRISEQQLSELEDDSTEVYNSNIIERYSDRPNRSHINGAFGHVDNLCLAEFAAYYYKNYKPIEDRQNDNHPVILTDQILDNQNSSPQNLPTKISLMTKNETMKCRKVKAVIRFHKPSKTTDAEKYFDHVLMLYFLWREESDLIGPEGPKVHMHQSCMIL